MNRLNLIPGPLRRSRAPLLAVAGVAAVAVTVVLVSLSVTLEHRRLAHEQSTVSAQAEALETDAAALRPAVARADLARAALTKLRGEAVSVPLLASLERLVPADVWVTTLQLRPGGADLAGGALRWQSIAQLIGAMRAAQMVPQLKSVTREAATVRIYRFSLTVAVRSATAAP